MSLFDKTAGNYVCDFIGIRHLELLIMFPMMTSSGDVQSGEKLHTNLRKSKKWKKKWRS